jgi:hypothetical protein
MAAPRSVNAERPEEADYLAAPPAAVPAVPCSSVTIRRAP